MKRIAALAATAAGILALTTFAGGAFANGQGGGPDKALSSEGVKPSNDTAKDTHAQAGSNQTKLYGNGKTAGQIAQANGASPTTDLHGPGNSQPHKVTRCPDGHEVDVHALKSHSGDACADHQKKAEVKGAEKSSQKTETKSETKSSSASESAKAHDHVTICHATGSATNPYVRISPSASGVFHGHLRHQDGRDIVPPFQYKGQTYSENWDANGQAIWNNDCNVPQQAAAQTQSQTQQQTSSEQPAATTAQTVTTQESAPAQQSTSSTSGVLGATHKLTPAKHHRAAAAKPAAKPKASNSGVLGATHALSPTPKKGSSGVLGTTLPFTGFPLWIALVAALGLLLAGGIARASARRM
jgi:hypothetical protein